LHDPGWYSIKGVAMSLVIGFDVYGTLVDPLELRIHLSDVAGDRAGPVAELWRAKQLEYSFRRGLMRDYQNFDVCTRQALEFATRAFGIDLTDGQRAQLLETYQQLELFPDALPGLQLLKDHGHRLCAFSNGVESTVRTLLERAGILTYLDDVVSVDDMRTFKPDPEVYHYLARRGGAPPQNTWLVSSNGWDTIGARVAGIRAAWVQRTHDTVFDPWGIEPDLVVADLVEFAGRILNQSGTHSVDA
jgi:2-haloacid dehalogenase